MQCRTSSTKRLFVFKEQRSSLALENKDNVIATEIKVDGCEITQGIRCDYMLLAKELELYIELKGQDIAHAVEQIETTMKQLSSNHRRTPKTSYIICTRSPLSSTEIQQHIRYFRANYNCELKIKSSPYKDSF